jgi:hypothetical protein
VVILFRHVLENVAEVEAVDGAPRLRGEEVLDGRAVPLEAVEVAADRVEVLGPQGEGQGGGVAALHDPLQVGVGGGVQFGDGVAGAGEDARADVALDVGEEARVAAHAAHDEA